MTSKRTLLVHIGVHRTATSSIQAHLQQHKGLLLDQGVMLANGRGRQQRLVNDLFSGARTPDEVAEALER
ncbi:MAG: hypothetical protein D6801_08325, partial [Alphaproteobacteria bacterium]